jgi:hypothetical protein
MAGPSPGGVRTRLDPRSPQPPPPAPGARCPPLSPPLPGWPGRRRTPACARVPPRLAAPVRRGPPSLAGGIGGRASRMRRPRPAPRGAGGWELESFFPPALAVLPARSSPSPAPGASFRLHPNLLGVCGWAPRDQARGRGATCAHHAWNARTPPESSPAHVRCSGQPARGRLLLPSFFLTFKRVGWWGGRFPNDSSRKRAREASLGYPGRCKGGAVSDPVFIVLLQRMTPCPTPEGNQPSRKVTRMESCGLLIQPIVFRKAGS